VLVTLKVMRAREDAFLLKYVLSAEFDFEEGEFGAKKNSKN